MPVAPTYPGVYIEEIPSGVRTITGVATSVAAFVDYFRRGAMNTAIQIFSQADFEREFGGLDPLSEASYAIPQFFLNGGSEAWVVRVASGTPLKATTLGRAAIGGGANIFTATALTEGTWGNNLRLAVDYDTTDPTNFFNLAISEVASVGGRTVVARQETFRNLSMLATLPSPPAAPSTPNPSYVKTVVNDDGTGSTLLRFDHPAATTTRPLQSGTVGIALTLPIAPPAVGAPLRVQVTLNVGGTPDVQVANLGTTQINSVDEAAARLEGALRNAKPSDQAWSQATARAVGTVLQVAAGPSAPNGFLTFAAAPAGSGGTPPADPSTVTGLALTGAGVVENVAAYQLGATTTVRAQQTGQAGNDGTPPDALALIGSAAVDPPSGIFALNKVDLFNILCLPRISKVSGAGANFPGAQVDTVVSTATNYCELRRAMLILDAPSDQVTVPAIKAWLTSKASLRHKNVAFYFPRVQIADPLDDFRLRSLAPCGTVAGVYARTDAARGVWKAPAGTESVVQGVSRLGYKLNDQENGTLNPLAIDCLRTFDVYGNVVWGARTLVGSDQQASEWKYVPIRRLALYLEESLYRGTQWVVFEPNDEPLWAQIRLNVGAFMHNLFRQGAFQGQTPRDAYFVKCDGETTTQNDRNLGIVNIVVGFAPLKPAEFVIIKIQQIAGQIQT